MKKIITVLLFSLTLAASELNWLHDYNTALRSAKAEKRDIYLFIGADHCRFCKKFKETTLTDKEVKQMLSEHFVTLYLSRDRHAVPDGFERFGVPRHYFLDANGKILDEDAGLLDPEAFLGLLNEVQLYR
jgi:thioredoxin-related protein